MYNTEDRRIFERFEDNLAVRYRRQGGKREFFTATNNISGSGANITIFRRFKPGNILDLEIYKNGSDLSAKCRGEVVWVSASGENGKVSCFNAGIRFIDSSLMHISALIKELNPHN